LDPCLLLKSYPWPELTSIAPYLLKVIKKSDLYTIPWKNNKSIEEPINKLKVYS
jgi:hypothetical protein